MSNVRVYPEQINHLWENAEKHWDVIFGKCTVLTVKLENGFVLTESSGCVDPENFDDAIGRECCEKRIRDKLWMLEGYALQKQVTEPCMMSPGSFGWAIESMKRGEKLRRRGWNGKGQYIELAKAISYKGADGTVVNCEHEAIGNKAIAFCGTSGVQMGWLASQADMLADDWEVAEQ